MLRRVAASLLVACTSAVVLACGSGHGAPSERVGERAVVVKRVRVAPRIIDLAIRSSALDATARVRLMTPDGWRASRPRRRWPVLYLLPGCCDTYDSWTRETDVERLPELRNVLVVMPAAGAVGFYSDWSNHGRGGAPAWETFHLVELRRMLERDYGAGRRRAIAGLSMGGLGAMAYAARHRGLFAAAAAYSGLLHPLEDAHAMLDLFAEHTSDPLAIWGDPANERDRWAAHDPLELAARLRGTRLFVAGGTGAPNDPVEATTYAESRAFVERLRRLRIPVQTDFYGGGAHDWPYWQRELHRSLPLLLAAIGARPHS